MLRPCRERQYIRGRPLGQASSCGTYNAPKSFQLFEWCSLERLERTSRSFRNTADHGHRLYRYPRRGRMKERGINLIKCMRSLDPYTGGSFMGSLCFEKPEIYSFQWCSFRSTTAHCGAGCLSIHTDVFRLPVSHQCRLFKRVAFPSSSEATRCSIVRLPCEQLRVRSQTLSFPPIFSTFRALKTQIDITSLGLGILSLTDRTSLWILIYARD